MRGCVVVDHSNVELLACPFCGRPAAIAGKRATRFPGSRKVSCSHDGCGAHFSYWHPDEWNRRAERSTQTEQRPVAMPPFAMQVLEKLRRVDECFSEGVDADVNRVWFDLLTDLGLLAVSGRHKWVITKQGREALATHAAQPEQSGLVPVLEHVSEGAEILQILIDNIEAKGNYSQETTVLFLNQALGCIRAAVSAQGGEA